METLTFNEDELGYLLAAALCKYKELDKRGLKNMAKKQLALAERISQFFIEKEIVKK